MTKHAKKRAHILPVTAFIAAGMAGQRLPASAR